MTTIDSCVELLVQLCLHTASVAKKFKHGDDLLKRFEAVKDRILSHQDDIRGLEDEAVMKTSLGRLHEPLAEAFTLFASLRTSTHFVNKKFGKRADELAEDIEKECQDLLTTTAIKIADVATQGSRQATQGIRNLALASGTPDWEPMDEDGATTLYLQACKYMFGVGVEPSHDLAFKRGLAAARFGLADAANMVGACYEKGLGVATDIQAALHWYRVAAEKDHADALNALGRLYEAGKGCECDIAAAVTFYRRAADQDHPDALTNLGYLYEHGRVDASSDQGDTAAETASTSGEGDSGSARAARLYRRAAVQGYARAENNLGSLYYSGKGVARNAGEAVAWFRKAAAQGHAAAQNNLGVCCEAGHGMPADLSLAKQLYGAAAEQHHAGAINNLGYCCLVEGDYETAEGHFRIAMAKGSLDAVYNLANMYGQGLLLEGVSPVSAAAYYRRAADRGYAKAQCALGIAYCSGCGVEQSLAEGASWFLLAAEQDDEEALLNYAEMLEEGLGVALDDAEAVRWYSRGHELGNAEARFRLARCIEDRRGVSETARLADALRLYEMAARDAHPEARERLAARHANPHDPLAHV